MITYFCHFGDGEVGEKFKSVIFGEIKLIPLLESNFLQSDLRNFEFDIMIRFYLDGEITKFYDVVDAEIIVDKKKKLLVFNKRMISNKANSFSLLETYNYILEATLEAINLFENNFNNLISKTSTIELKSVVTDSFKDIYKSNVISSE